MVSKSARAAWRAWASSAVRDSTDTTSAGARLSTVECRYVAIASRWLLISGTTVVVTVETDNVAVLR